MQFIKDHFITFSLIVTIAFTVWLAGNLGAFGINKIKHDVIGYHSYFPALFIKKDLKLNFYKDTIAAAEYNTNDMYWANRTKEGQPIIKYTCGLSLMYLPFTIWPYLFGGTDQTGYELSYSIAISISNLFYYSVGLLITVALLKKLRFSPFAIGMTVFCIGLGTNAVSYASVSVGMPHAYGFFLVSCLLFLCLKWIEGPSLKFSTLLGCVFGLLILIRPTNFIFLACLFLLQPFSFYLNKWKQILLMGSVALAIQLPQLLYWHYVTGHFFYNSYVDEGFFMLHPHLIEYLVGFRKGWFIYTPLILVGLVGLFSLKRSNPFFKATLIIVPLMIYINSSWWCWWFGGGHSARAMIESYPLLTIGFASAFEIVKEQKRKLLAGVCWFLIAFNLKSVDLYRASIIHYDSMTYKAFVYTSFKILFSPEDKEYLKTLYKAPNYASAKRGEAS